MAKAAASWSYASKVGSLGDVATGEAMYRFDYTDMIAGFLLILTGLAVSYVSVQNYPLGSLTRMGPGMFAAGLGGILAFLGLLLSLQSLRRKGTKPDVRIFSPLFVLGGIAAFALLVGPFGLIPAIIGVTVVSSMAELRLRPGSLLALCLGLSLLAPFVFKLCLGLPIALFNWPF